jgi:sugar phosphate isomerase/epimerase
MAADMKMPIGVFASIGAGLGAQIDAVGEMGVDSVQIVAPPQEYCTADHARKVAQQFADIGVEPTLVFCGFEGESYASIQVVRETVGLVPEDTREERIERTRRIADFTKALGAPGIGLHAGFISEDWESQAFSDVVDVLKHVCDYCSGLDLRVNLETGQESVETLLHTLDQVDRENLGVNFDPANMILYGSGEPLDALQRVGSHVRSVHAKDAVWSDQPGETFGEEVPLGEGDVNMEKFLTILNDLGYEGPLTIEREIAGEEQIQDIKAGIETLRTLKEKLGIA